MPLDPTAPPPRSHLGRGLQYAIEGGMYAIVVAAPWAFGAWEPFDFYFYCGLTALLVLWAARVLVEWRFTWKPCPMAMCLAALFLVGIVQLVPLSPDLLRSLSPTAANLYAGLLPGTPEQLPFDTAAEPTAVPPGRTLSLYPSGTRLQLFQLLALFLFYVVVRNNCASVEVLRRLALVALANGTLLGLLGLLQYLTSDFHHLYWTFKSPHLGTVYGPFLCRNHFPFYVNMCIGLALGLLFSLRYHVHGYLPAEIISRSRPRLHLDESPYELIHPPLLLRSWNEIFHDSRVLWISFPICLMVASVVCSLSRGGLLALLGAVAVGVVLGVPRDRRWTGLLLLVLIVGGVVSLFSWFGFDILESRHATILKGELFDDRMELWKTAWPLVGQFPWTGTGYGTFQCVEPLNRPPSVDAYYLSTHAHNDYLEALVEGGIPRLVLTLLLVIAVFWLGVRAMRRYSHRSAHGLAMGAITALAAVIIHSFGDFGIHVPAVALLACAIAAQLSAVALDPDEHRPAAIPLESDAILPYQLGGVVPPVAAVVLVTLALVVATGSWRNNRVFQYRMAAQQQNFAVRPPTPSMDPEVGLKLDVLPLEKKVAYLREAIRLAPDYAVVRLQMANALGTLLRAKEEEVLRQCYSGEVAALVLSGAATAAGAQWLGEPREVLAELGLATAAPMRLFLPAQTREACKPLLAEQLKHLLVARDLCPLLPQPHLRIAENVSNFAKAEPRSAYLARAKRLRDFDANLWYECGSQEWLDGQYDEAIKSWRACLERLDAGASDADAIFLAILAQAQQRPLASGEAVTANRKLASAEDIMNRLIPDKPKLILRAAKELLGSDADKAKRQVYLEKALRLLGTPKKADELHTAALICISLGKDKEAEEYLARAVTLEASQWEWRLELGKLYFELKRYDDCIIQLEMVAKQRPQDEKLKHMLEAAKTELKARMK